MPVINTNIVSQVSQSILHRTKSAANTAIERLASGLRIQSAKDDSAGLGIANRFTSQLLCFSKVKRNLQDGLSLIQTSDSVLSEINNNLQRLRELTVQAQNGTNSNADLDIIQIEIDQILNQIDSIANQSQFNGLSLLDRNQLIDIQLGLNDGDTIPLQLSQINRSTLGLDRFSVVDKEEVREKINNPQPITTEDIRTIIERYGPELLPTSGNTDSLSIHIWGSDFNFLKDNNGVGLRQIESTIEKDDEGNFYIGVKFYAQNENGEASLLNLNLDPNERYYVSFEDLMQLTAHSSESTPGAGDQPIAISVKVRPWGLSLSDLTPSAGSEGKVRSGVIAQIDVAIMKIDTFRGDLGAVYNRLDSVANYVGMKVNVVSSARSRIEDADYSIEISSLTRAMILQNAGMASLSQANQIPNLALSLLR